MLIYFFFFFILKTVVLLNISVETLVPFSRILSKNKIKKITAFI